MAERATEPEFLASIRDLGDVVRDELARLTGKRVMLVDVEVAARLLDGWSEPLQHRAIEGKSGTLELEFRTPKWEQ